MRFDPGLSLPEEHHECLTDVSEVVVALDRSVGVECDVAEHLHADDRVNEEQHHHQHHDVRQGLKREPVVEVFDFKLFVAFVVVFL